MVMTHTHRIKYRYYYHLALGSPSNSISTIFGDTISRVSVKDFRLVPAPLQKNPTEIDRAYLDKHLSRRHGNLQQRQGCFSVPAEILRSDPHHQSRLGGFGSQTEI